MRAAENRMCILDQFSMSRTGSKSLLNWARAEPKPVRLTEPLALRWLDLYLYLGVGVVKGQLEK